MEDEIQLDSNLRSDKFLYEDLEKKVMDIVFRLVDQNKIIDFAKIYHICIHELKLESVIILNILERLQQKKRIIFGQKVIRDLVLVNPTRKLIYNYIKSNPGVIYAQIQQNLALNSSVLEWNMAVLLRFNCLIEVHIGKKRVYGIKDHLPNSIKFNYFSNNEKIFKILSLLVKKSSSIKEIISFSGFSYNFVFYQLNLLVNERILIIEMSTTEKMYCVSDNYQKFFNEKIKFNRISHSKP